MSYDLEDYRYDRPLPSDITMRTPVYRRRGVIASLIADALAAWSARRQLRRITRQYRGLSPQPIPDYLREDIGLPPLPKRLPNWWEAPR
jgi:hypothetical protein